jgi:hypothetical protein
MKDIYQVLREKEQAVTRVRQEIEALRFCLPLLEGEGTTGQATAGDYRKPPRDAARAPNPYQN